MNIDPLKTEITNDPQTRGYAVMVNGFGCVVMRAELLRDNVFTFAQGVRHYDQEFYRRIPADRRRLVDWSCECEHLQEPRT